MKMNAPYSGLLTFTVKAAGLISTNVGSTEAIRMPTPNGMAIITGTAGGMEMNMIEAKDFFSVTVQQPKGSWLITVTTQSKVPVAIETLFQK
jgi:hypothetical protein